MLFTSIDKLHTIEITKFGDIAELQIIAFHYENYKTFLLLLKNVIEYMARENIKFVKQKILETDIPLFTKSTIDTYIQKGEKDKDSIRTVLITTPIIHIAEEIYNALGLKKV
jgi:hypothetical protein